MSEKLKNSTNPVEHTAWDDLARDGDNNAPAPDIIYLGPNPSVINLGTSKVEEPKPLALEDKQAKILAIEDKQAKQTPEIDTSGTLTKEEIDALLGNNEELAKAPEKEPVDVEKIKNDLYELVQQSLELEDQKNKEAEINQAKEDLYQNILEQLALEDAEMAPEATEAAESHETAEETEEAPEEAKNTPETPLTAINIDYTHDEKELAHDLAEQALNAEISDAKGLKGAVKRIWKGTLFKKFYETKYEKEFRDGKRTNENGETVMDLLQKQMPETMERFVLGVVEDDRFIHRYIGKQDKNGNYKDGEKLEKLDDETNEKIKSAIAEYARKRPAAGEKVSDLNREFSNEIGRILAELNDEKGSNTSSNNYLEVAKQAADRYQELAINAKTEAEHEAAIARVMEGFQAYNAEARTNVRTEVHRDNIDKIVNAIESSKIGQFIPAEILAGAAGIAAGLTQTGARAILGAGGGIIASSAISGLKERNRITEDRARMLRDVANGMDYGDNKKTAKYEQRIGGTLYDMRSASDLTANIQEALDYHGKGRVSKIMEALAEARVRIDFSDSEQKDLISFSSADNRGKERLELDKILIKAEHALTEKGRARYEEVQDAIWDEIVNGYEDESGEYHAGVAEQDKDFKNYRALAALKKSGKTLALGVTTFFASQEIMAAVDPAKIGVFEKAGLIKTENAQDAEETILASGFGRLRGTYEVAGAGQSDIRGNVSDPEQIQRYENAGYTKVETVPASSTTTSHIEAVDPSASTARVDVKYDGWANNGTRFSDGNELRARIENGQFISTMQGSSTMAGQTIDYDPTSVKAFITIGDAKFEIAGSLNEAGQMTWGEGGVFTTTTGETIRAIGDNGEKLYKYFEIAADNGVDADGIQHIIPLATDVGRDTFTGKIEQVVETITETPATYTFTKEIPGVSETFIRGINFNGIGLAPETARRGLGRARTAGETVETAEPAPETAAETSPEAPEVVEAPEEPENTANASEAPVEAPEAPEVEISELTPEEIEETPAEVEETPTEEAPAPESEPTSYDQWDASIKNIIASYRDVIGDQGVSLLTDQRKYDQNTQNEYLDWFSGLSEENQAVVRDLMNTINSSPYSSERNWGNGFATFLALNPQVNG